MGCGSSSHMVPSIGDSTSIIKPSPVTTLSPVSTGDSVLKDLPDVVEKVIEVLKVSDSDIAHGQTTEIETQHGLHFEVDNRLPVVDDSKIMHDTDSENSLQGIVQGFLDDNTSNSSQQSLDIEEHFNIERKSSIVSADADSLRTSSPESEIEEALANINDQNPPTPKPTFSELRDLAMFQINTIISTSAFVKPEEDSISIVSEKIKDSNNSNKSDNNIPQVIKIPTEWEIQADLLAKTQKFNPLDAMRKFRKENRSNSCLPHREDLRPKSQRNFEEDSSDFVPRQSPLRSALSSARSERGVKPKLSESNANGYINTIHNHTPHKRIQEIKIKKPPDTKAKHTNLTVSQNARGAPSPSLYKVRERCAVCCNKYKH